VSVLGEIVDSYPSSRIENSQPAGIGRVVALGDLAAWNNLGRNIVFADRSLRPRALFDDTLYPEDDEPSQYDFDVHAIVDVPGADLVLTLNHLGLLRAFRASDIPTRGPVRRLRPVWARAFAPDVERVAVAADRLVGSRPRSDKAGGLLVSEPLSLLADPGPLATRAALETWGEVTALAAVPDDGEQAIAVGGAGRITLVPFAGGTAGRPRWDIEVGFRTAAFAWEGGVLWAAGSGIAAGIGDYEWEKVRGGAFAALDPTNGRVLASAPLPDDIAWGNGGVAFVVLGGVPCGIARSAELYILHSDGEAPRSYLPRTARSLGIAHAAVVADRLLYGFNRGGYRLHAVDGVAVRRLVASGS
jgi:hypothetical protein